MTTCIRVTLSLPEELVWFADMSAAKHNLSRSRFIAALLREMAEQEQQLLMAEGYQAMARENAEVAEAAVSLAEEVLPRWE